MPYYLIQLIIFERLEPYEVKVSRTVLRRGRSREASSLSDIGRGYQSVSSEPSGSNFGWFVSWRDRSDPAAHGKHYAYLQ